MAELEPQSMRSAAVITFLAVVSLFVSGCTTLANVGPSTATLQDASGQPGPGGSTIQVIPVDDAVVRRLIAQTQPRLFSEVLATPAPAATPAIVGLGDTLEISIWEAPPATLFSSGLTADVRGNTSGSHAVTLPEQTVDRDGFVYVPFAGRVPAVGRMTTDVEVEIARRLKGKANQPEAMVRRMRNASSTVTVVGEVANSLRMPLTPSGERLLDAIAAAGGVRQPVNKMTLQVTRGSAFYAMPLQAVIRDPRQNVALQSGDVVTAISQSLSFTALGSTNKNEEVPFEAQGITLAQAIARAGGLNDARSDARGVFVFRLEQKAALNWPTQSVATTPDGLVPVVYSVNLRDPASFFVMQTFEVRDKDVLYVSNAPAAELQKFLNLVLSVAYPALTTYQLTR